jgi:hypothetical protein
MADEIFLVLISLVKIMWKITSGVLEDPYFNIGS